VNATLYWPSFVLLLGMVGGFAVAVGAFRRHPATGATSLGMVSATTAVAAGCTLMASWLPALRSAPWLWAARYLVSAAVPVAWYGLTVSLVSMGQRPSTCVLARLMVLPVLTALLAASGSQHVLLWTSDGSPGLWLWVYASYSVLLVMAGGAALLRDGQPIRAWRPEVIWVLMLTGVLAGGISLASSWIGGGWAVSLLPLAAAGCSALLLQVLYLQPAREMSGLSAQALGGEADDAVLALDGRNRVTDANAPALLLLAEYGVWQAVGRPADKVLTGPLAPLASVGVDGAVTLTLADGSRIIRSRELPLGSTPWVGRALLLQDVAENAGGATGPIGKDAAKPQACPDRVAQEQMDAG